MINYKVTSFVLGAVLLVAATAGTSVYFTRQTEQPQQPVKVVVKNQPQPQKVVSKCNDDNIAGKAVGGVGGGILGSLVGGGTGKTAATIGGALGGAYLGGKTIPLQNETCK